MSLQARMNSFGNIQITLISIMIALTIGMGFYEGWLFFRDKVQECRNKNKREVWDLKAELKKKAERRRIAEEEALKKKEEEERMEQQSLNPFANL